MRISRKARKSHSSILNIYAGMKDEIKEAQKEIDELKVSFSSFLIKTRLRRRCIERRPIFTNER
jgi:hypothetical protein